MLRQRFLAGVLVLIVAGFVPLAFGQTVDGHLVGVVLDPSGGAVPAADMQLTNQATGVTANAKTDVAGDYRFNNVPAGKYRLSASAPGFAREALQNVEVELNKTTTVNLSLRVGAVTTQLEVAEAAALIDTTTAQITKTYSGREALDLPSTGQTLGVVNLSLLSAGVASSGGLGLGEGPSVGGQRPRNNNFTIEGVDNNRKDTAGHVAIVPIEAVAEFSVLQNQFSAEFGHSSGGQFNTTVKSGTNEVHGSIYEYLQNRNLNAVDQSAKRQGILSNPRFDNNDLGATIGGPIIRNKLFYFGNFDYNPIGTAATSSSATLAPTAAGYQALGGIPGISATNLSVLQKYLSPAPAGTSTTTVSGVSIPIGVLPITIPFYQNNYSWLASVDYNLSTRDQIRSRYVDNKTANSVNPSNLPNLPSFLTGRNTTAKVFSFSEFHTFTPAVFNELRLAYNRYNDVTPAGNFTFPGLDAFPTIAIQQDLNVQLGPGTLSPQSTIIGAYQVVDNLSYTRGRHTLKFGGDARKYISGSSFTQRLRGEYDYSNLERYLLDLNPDVLGTRNPYGSPFAGNQLSLYWFANDDFRIRHNLTLNLGIRYEYNGIPAGYKLQTLNAIADAPGLITFGVPQAQTKNFVPRIGLAWSPGRSGTTVIRAGFGMANDVLFDNIGLNTKPPQVSTTVTIPPASNISNFLANGAIPATAVPGALTQAQARKLTSGYYGDQQLPQAINWNIGVQRVFHQDYTVEVRYVGTRGVHLYTQSQLNILSPVTPSNSLPTYLQQPSQAQLDGLGLTLASMRAHADPYVPAYEAAGFLSPITTFLSRGNSSYHGLATEVTRRFSRGLLFKGAYTWSHNIDDSTAEFSSTLLTPRRPQDSQNMRPERSSSMLDRRQRLTLTWMYETPWFRQNNSWFLKNLAGNWNLTGTYFAESPEYATVQSALDSNLNFDTASDRVIINPAGNPNVGSDVTALKNSSGDTVAYLANNSNARYIRAGLGALANGGRNTLPLRGINSFDVAVIKNFAIRESKRLEVRALFFNFFNHAQYIPGSIDSATFVSSATTRNELIPGNPLFNDPTRVFSSNPRNIWLAARFVF